MATEGRQSFKVTSQLYSERMQEEGMVLFAIRNKCHATSNRCLTSSNKKLLGTSALLVVTGALLVVTRSY